MPRVGLCRVNSFRDLRERKGRTLLPWIAYAILSSNGLLSYFQVIIDKHILRSIYIFWCTDGGWLTLNSGDVRVNKVFFKDRTLSQNGFYLRSMPSTMRGPI